MFNVPASELGMKWKVMLSTADKDIKEESIKGRTFTVPPRAIAVICEV